MEERNLIDHCPYCGSKEGVYYKDYGHVIEYFESFSGVREATQIYSKRKPPRFGKCAECGKRIPLIKMKLRHKD